MLPEFITFTGADFHTIGAEMAALSAKFPIEWGILFSPKRQGLERRYPSVRYIEWLVTNFPGLRYAAHLCGGDAREVLEHGRSRHDDLLHKHFTRVQINTTQHVRTAEVKTWGDALSLGVIVQTRDSFPRNTDVEWLFDKSGGRGVEQTIWPQPVQDQRVVYAGGLRPDNVAKAVRSMMAGAPADQRFWIDMESGVRDEHDFFRLDKCRAVCQAVYGAPSPDAGKRQEGAE